MDFKVHCSPPRPQRGMLKKTLLIMKFTGILLFIACLQVSAKGYSQITLSEKNAPLQKVFKQIQKQTGYDFLYSVELLEKAGTVSIEVRNVSLEKALELCIKDKPIVYSIVENTIVIKPKEKSLVEMTTENMLPPIDVKGRVVNESGDPVEGVTVTVKGTKKATSTNANGEFTLTGVDDKAVLVFTAVTIDAYEVEIKGRNNIAVAVKAKVDKMQEVVVNNGLFKKNKETFTGSSTVVSGDELRAVNMVNALDALKVFDPAVRITDNVQFGSDPNRLPNITLRGTNNFPQQTTGSQVPVSGADFTANYINNPNQPLFILDGFEVSLQKIYDLDINRVATFTILKDAAATSIYGSRAANGVILVETKQPLAGKLRVSYNGTMQITAPDLNVYDLTNAAEKLEVERLAGVYSAYSNGIRPDLDAVARENYANRKAAVERGVNTYWLSQPVQTGFGQRHSLYLEGGDNAIRYGIDLGYNNTAGVMKNSDRTVYTGGMNLSYRYKGLLFKNTLTVSVNKAVNSNFGSFSDYTKQNPFWSPTDAQGNIVKVLESVKVGLGPSSFNYINYTNPLYNTTLNTINESTYTNFINQTNLDWSMGKGFRLNGRLQLYKQHDQSDLFLPAKHTSFDGITDVAKKGSYTKGSGSFFSYDGSLQLEYSKRLGQHQLNNVTGVSMMQTQSDFLSVYVEGFPNDKLDEISFGNAYPANSRPTYRADITRMASAYTNFSYSYNSLYNADVSIRTDGSSQFGSEKRFGTFWSAGASWNLHKEKFLADKKYISLFRLRGSIGTTGDNKFQPFMGINTYQYYTDQNYNGQVGTLLKGYGNKDLQWQETLKKNVGIDIGFWKNLITASFDLYRENTSELILDITTPPSVGFSSYRENVGELENKGYEFKLNAFALRNEKKRTYLSFFVNGLHNADKIKSISNSLKKLNETNDKNDQTRPQYRFQEGESVNAIWAVKSLGIDPSNGRELYVKKDGTITYNWDVADKIVIGNAVPDLRGNFGSNFSWKGLSLGIYFSYEFGGQLYNQTLIDRVDVTSFTYNVDRRVLLGRWKAPGDVTYFKGLVDENGKTVTTATNASSRFVQDVNFVNAESISLSYQVPEKLNKKIGLSNTRIGFIANDIQRWSSIQVERGLDYPFARNFTINISTSF
jgi:TonB-linked SusC/RagA family outer membrane protein